MRFRPLIAALLTLSLGVLTAHAGEDGGADAVKEAVGSESLLTLTATVTAVDQKTRQVTLKDAEGKLHTITVSDDVKNLAQVAVGDQLDVTYYESVTFEVLAPGAAQDEAAAAAVMGTAEPGEKPAAAAASELAFVATVVGINKDADTVDLKGPAGNTKTVQVSNPDNLDKVAVGDELLITVTQAFAVGVSAASSKE